MNYFSFQPFSTTEIGQSLRFVGSDGAHVIRPSVRHFSRSEQTLPCYPVNLYKFVEVEQNKIIGLNHFHSEKDKNVVYYDGKCINGFH